MKRRIARKLQKLRDAGYDDGLKLAGRKSKHRAYTEEWQRAYWETAVVGEYCQTVYLAGTGTFISIFN